MSESGVSLAVAPGTGETEIDPMSNIRESTNNHMKNTTSNTLTRRKGTGIMGSIRVIELQLVAFIMVFSLSGLVPLWDLLFPVITSTYILALSWLAFPPRPSSASGISTPPSSEPYVFQADVGVLMGIYVAVGSTTGLLLPLAYVLGGFARGDQKAVGCATPHLFLLSFQILTENVMSGFSSLFSPPIRAMVPLLYTARRIFVLLHWTRDVWLDNNQLSDIFTSVINVLKSQSVVQSDPKSKFDYVASIKLDKDVAWVWFGRCLAVANLVYFSINLLCFLIPYHLPRAFRTYFNQIGEHNHEMQSKIIHDQNRFASSSSLVQEKNKKDD